MINFTCTHCGWSLKADAKYADQVARCPKCKLKVKVPGQPSVFTQDPLQPPEFVVPAAMAKPSPPSAPRPEVPANHSTDNIWSTVDWYLRRFWANDICRVTFKTLSALFLAILCLSTSGRPSPSPLVLLSYASLIAFLFLFSLWAFASSRRTRRYRYYAATAVTLLILFLAGKYDMYDDRHTLDDGTLIITTYKRWGRTPVERFIQLSGGSTAWGPTTPSGKRHGKWTFWVGQFPEDRWYWYGEAVTEGEFVLRSK